LAFLMTKAEKRTQQAKNDENPPFPSLRATEGSEAISSNYAKRIESIRLIVHSFWYIVFIINVKDIWITEYQIAKIVISRWFLVKSKYKYKDCGL
jgi:hypothetical protein